MKVILFDGVCNLCSGSVNWIIDHDKKNLFKFSALQSNYGKGIVAKYNMEGNYMDTAILLDEDDIFLGSDAVLRILKHLGGIYSLAYLFIIVPAFIRNFVYQVVSENRYRWFGKMDTCRIPTPQLKANFLE